MIYNITLIERRKEKTKINKKTEYIIRKNDDGRTYQAAEKWRKHKKQELPISKQAQEERAMVVEEAAATPPEAPPAPPSIAPEPRRR